jgi:hypothetical protein
MALCERSRLGEIFRGSIIFAENFILGRECAKDFLSFHESMPSS